MGNIITLGGSTEPIEDSETDFIKQNLESIVMLPGCGEESLSSYNALDEVCNLFPHLKQIGVIVSWFVDKLDIATCTLKPGVEPRGKSEWSVGEFNRKTAHQITMVSNEYGNRVVNYGGTVSDQSLFNYIKEIKQRNKEVALYPMIMVDDTNKTWRGYLDGSANDVDSFYTNQYKPFIMHYANLLKGNVDIFYIGSELEKLTSIKNQSGALPFVERLVSLASELNTLLNNEVQLSYASNWTEYRHLDKLWMSHNINFIGINYYMPVTDEEHTAITKEVIKNGFISGEGIDYYKDGDTKKALSTEYQWKNIKEWYSKKHQEWDPANNTFKRVTWTPESKPVVFSEFGLRSLDRATDAPHLYGDNYPAHSSRRQDNNLQKIYICAMLEYIKENGFIEYGSLYGYDSRSKGWQKSYADGKYHAKGHWIDGQIV